MARLEVTELSVCYGAIRALDGVSLTVAEGGLVALIGANGAGKSSLLRAVSGLLTPEGGRVQVEGRDITGWPSEAVARAGVSHVPEGRQNFATLSVRENLLVGGYTTRSRVGRRGVDAAVARVYELFPVLGRRQSQLAGSLSGGEQQMLAIGRGLMAGPRLLLLDEPSVGLAPLLVREILQTIRALPAAGTTVLLVEQNARAALRVADYAYVLAHGRLTLEGKCSELMENEEVQRAYLGRA
jgi:branched-chain amino acid transport system ATP-binding protein